MGRPGRLPGTAAGTPRPGPGATASGRQNDCSEVGMAMTMHGDEQYERGLRALRDAGGDAGQRLVDALADI